MKAFRALTQEDLAEIGTLVLLGEEAALFDIVHKPGQVMKKWLAAIALEGIQSGNMDSLDKLLNRLIGKVKEKVEHSGNITLEDLVAGSRDKE